MARRGQQGNQHFEISIDKLVYGGDGLGRHEGKVVFVPFSAPGDRLLVKAVEQKKNFCRARIVSTVEEGPGRIAPACPHFGSCGGCQWQHLQYECQVEIKRRILSETIRHRFPETSNLSIEMEPSPQVFGYRSRGRVQVRGFGAEARIGFYRLESHSVEDVEICPLFQPTLNEGLKALREAVRRGLSDPSVREMELAASEEDRKWGAVEAEPGTEDELSALGRPETVALGETRLRRSAGSFTYAVSPAAFFQANAPMLESLVTRVMGALAGPGEAEALDLFAGVGLFTLPLAQHYRKVVAVESSAGACRLLEQNSEAAGISNIQVICAEVAPWMKAVHSITSPAYDLVLLDPPRSGAGQTVMQLIREWGPETVVYVSCDPQTLCRDVALLPARDYRIDFVRGLDLFPQTYHFETVMRLRKR